MTRKVSFAFFVNKNDQDSLHKFGETTTKIISEDRLVTYFLCNHNYNFISMLIGKVYAFQRNATVIHMYMCTRCVFYFMGDNILHTVLYSSFYCNK